MTLSEVKPDENICKSFLEIYPMQKEVILSCKLQYPAYE